MVSAAANSFHRHSGSSSTSRTAGHAAITPQRLRQSAASAQVSAVMHDSSCGMACRSCRAGMDVLGHHLAAIPVAGRGRNGE
jgi:hypothetical protein